ncbi:unnamed protein product [Durusdinium trenchii]|uniref:Uncharacterized protein n=1 Tax=Durusdinium trenchii TaxID=1381693 RepID=A0ABP0QG13_9DINO
MTKCMKYDDKVHSAGPLNERATGCWATLVESRMQVITCTNPLPDPFQEVIVGCLACVEAVYDGISILPYLPGNLQKKIGPLKGTLNKIEQVLYELALLSQGVKTTFEEINDDSDLGN